MVLTKFRRLDCNENGFALEVSRHPRPNLLPRTHPCLPADWFAWHVLWRPRVSCSSSPLPPPLPPQHKGFGFVQYAQETVARTVIDVGYALRFGVSGLAWPLCPVLVPVFEECGLARLLCFAAMLCLAAFEYPVCGSCSFPPCPTLRFVFTPPASRCGVPCFLESAKFCWIFFVLAAVCAVLHRRIRLFVPTTAEAGTSLTPSVCWGAKAKSVQCSLPRLGLMFACSSLLSGGTPVDDLCMTCPVCRGERHDMIWPRFLGGFILVVCSPSLQAPRPFDKQRPTKEQKQHPP